MSVGQHIGIIAARCFKNVDNILCKCVANDSCIHIFTREMVNYNDENILAFKVLFLPALCPNNTPAKKPKVKNVKAAPMTHQIQIQNRNSDLLLAQTENKHGIKLL